MGRVCWQHLNLDNLQIFPIIVENYPCSFCQIFLWSADGINNIDEDLVTTPSVFNIVNVNIYVAMKKGLYIYDRNEHVLIPLIDTDLRWLTGKFDYVKDSPVTVIYVADYSKSVQVDKSKRLMLASGRAGAMAQNVYLFCAAFDLNTALRVNVDRELLAETMKLEEHQYVLFAQSIGYPLFRK